MSKIDCVCDTCGKKKKCSEEEPAPKGWFYFQVHENDSKEVVTSTILACSTDCMVLPWTKYAPTKKEKKDG